MNCDYCGEVRKTKTAVFKGAFGHYCGQCLKGEKRTANSGHAQYSRDRDREDNSKDLLQPWGRDGKPNREFINAYPEEASDIFNEKDLRDYQ